MKAQAGILESDSADRSRRSSRRAVADVAADATKPTGGLAAAAPRRPRRREDEASARAERALLGLADVLRGARGRPRRSCSCSRTCTGPTTGCSTSSTSSSSGRASAPILVALHRAAGAARAAARVGRRQGERLHDLAAAARGRRDGAAARVAARAARAAERRRRPTLLGARRRQPALCRAVRPDACGARAASELALPETVQGIIAARLDALSAGGEDAAPGRGGRRQGLLARRGARAAAATAVRPRRRCARSSGKEFVRRARRSSVEGEPEYAFQHLLVRDVAYGQIPRAARADKHRAAALWIEELGRPEDHAEMLAHALLARARVRPCGRAGVSRARRARASGAARGRRARGVAPGLACGGPLLRRSPRALARGRSAASAGRAQRAVERSSPWTARASSS